MAKKQKEMDNIARLSCEAWERGISYGKLVAMNYEAEQKERAQRPPRPREPKQGERVCKFCGAIFTPIHGSQKYCTRDCEYNYNHPPKPPKVKTCPICEKEFTAKVGYQKYCSEDCRNESVYLRSMAAYQRRKENGTV